MAALGWDELDVLLISGDAYVDSHSFAMPLLGRWLLKHGFKTGILAQPGWENTDDIVRMGRPRLFAGISAGAMDSLLAHYTAFRKKRHDDAYSPGGKAGLRPNRASLVYTGLVRQAFPGLPVALGGIEASLRRASHYDFWSDSLRRSILLDSKADVVLYGMGENSILSFARLLDESPTRQRPADVIAQARLRGSAYAVHPDAIPADAEELPSHEAIEADAGLLIKATLAFERQMLNEGPCLVQRSGGRAVVFEPPAKLLTEAEMDELYELPFTHRAHPGYAEAVPAVAMLEGSIASHRGCGGGCSFCSLALHQGRRIQSRSAESIMKEVRTRSEGPDWKGAITDIGGPSSNMWQAECEVEGQDCKRSSCLYPKRCRNFRANQEGQVRLLREVAALPGVNHVRVASGVRHDLALESEEYMRALVGEFTGGQLKIAPEHISERVLRHMRKTSVKLWNQFLRDFDKICRETGKEQYVIPYLMSAFPGCTDADMEEMAAWLKVRGWRPQQVQCFIPTPGTLASAMFYAGQDAEGRPIFVARTDADRLRQHRILVPDAEPRTSMGGRPFSPDRPKQPFSSDRPKRPFRSDRPGRPYNADADRFAARKGSGEGGERKGGFNKKPGGFKPGGYKSDGKPGGFKSGGGSSGYSKPGGYTPGGKPGGFKSGGTSGNYSKPGGFKSGGGSGGYSKPGGYTPGGKPGGFKSGSTSGNFSKPGGGSGGYSKPDGYTPGGKPGGAKSNGGSGNYSKPGGYRSDGKPGGFKSGGKPGGFNKKPGGGPGGKPGGFRGKPRSGGGER